MTVYCTSFCNKGHRLSDGKPIDHECYVLPPAALAAEQGGDTQKATGLIEAAKPLQVHRGAKNASTPFAIGRRWLCSPPGRARFWFVIIGPGTNDLNKPSKVHKRCRIEVHPEDRHMASGRSHGLESTYSHKHLKKHATLEPLEASDAASS